jgi:hypothetical protein
LLNVVALGTNYKPSEEETELMETMEVKYKSELKELEDIGFKDRLRNIKALVET